jgi:hypothetical protein
MSRVRQLHFHKEDSEGKELDPFLAALTGLFVPKSRRGQMSRVRQLHFHKEDSEGKELDPFLAALTGLFAKTLSRV